MGYTQRVIEVGLLLDHHNGPEQERDRQLADEIRQRILAVLREPRFEHLLGGIYSVRDS